MSHTNAYAEILGQAVDLSRPLPAADRPEFAEAAEALADDLYRLCIEFGVSFNEFKKAVLDEVADRTRMLAAARGQDAGAASLLREVQSHTPLIILALELMREDSAF